MKERGKIGEQQREDVEGALPPLSRLLKAAFIQWLRPQTTHTPCQKCALTVITSLHSGITHSHFNAFVLLQGTGSKRNLENLERFPLIVVTISLTCRLNIKAVPGLQDAVEVKLFICPSFYRKIKQHLDRMLCVDEHERQTCKHTHAGK